MSAVRKIICCHSIWSYFAIYRFSGEECAQWEFLPRVMKELNKLLVYRYFKEFEKKIPEWSLPRQILRRVNLSHRYLVHYTPCSEHPEISMKCHEFRCIHQKQRNWLLSQGLIHVKENRWNLKIIIFRLFFCLLNWIHHLLVLEYGKILSKSLHSWKSRTGEI